MVSNRNRGEGEKRKGLAGSDKDSFVVEASDVLFMQGCRRENYPWVLRDRHLQQRQRAHSQSHKVNTDETKAGGGFLGPPAIWLRAGLFLQILTTAVGVVGSHKLPLPRLPKPWGWKSLLALEPVSLTILG